MRSETERSTRRHGCTGLYRCSSQAEVPGSVQDVHRPRERGRKMVQIAPQVGAPARGSAREALFN